MEPLTWFWTLVIGFFVGYIFWPSKRPKNFPPTPSRLPIFGNAIQFGGIGYKVAVEHEKYLGNIIGLQFGSYWAVIFNNLDDFREVLNKSEFSGRTGYNGLLDENHGPATNYGVIMSEGKRWTDLRRFSLKTLRDHGFGRRSMESIIQEESQDLIEEFKKVVGQPISTQNKFNAAVLNVVWSIISGKRYSHSDPKLIELNTLLTTFIQSSFEGIRLLNFMFPWAVTLRKKFPFLFPKTIEEFKNKVFQFLRAIIQEHRETLQVGNPRDFIDTYLEESIKGQGDPTTSFPTDDEDLNLIVLLMDFFIAGSETTSTTLTWAFFLLALHPEAQEKLFDEIRQVCGNRTVTLEDRVNLPFVEATITEIMRMSSLVPMGIPHGTTQDVVYKGYNIPKGTLIFGNLYAVHFNPNWGDPHNFRPQRFLSPDGVFTRPSNVVPFGVGKRSCLGEALAKDEFYIFLTNAVQQFKITMPKDEPKHSMNGQRGLVLIPEPHRIILLDRNS